MIENKEYKTNEEQRTKARNRYRKAHNIPLDAKLYAYRNETVKVRKPKPSRKTMLPPEPPTQEPNAQSQEPVKPPIVNRNLIEMIVERVLSELQISKK